MLRWKYILALVLPGIMSFGFLEAYAKIKAPSTEVSDCGFVQNIYNHRLSWKGELPIKMSIHKSVPKNMIPTIRAAMNTWNKDLGRKIFEISDVEVAGSKQLNGLKDSRNVIYWFNKGEWMSEQDDQARTIISWAGNKIQEADILINADHVQFYATAHGAGHGKKYGKKGQVDLQSVVLHELGHVLGLKHNDARPGIMESYLKENTERRQLVTADLTDIKCEYN